MNCISFFGNAVELNLLSGHVTAENELLIEILKKQTDEMISELQGEKEREKEEEREREKEKAEVEKFRETVARLKTEASISTLSFSSPTSFLCSPLPFRLDFISSLSVFSTPSLPALIVVCAALVLGLSSTFPPPPHLLSPPRLLLPLYLILPSA